jgi:hypothetical protein
MMEEMHFHSQLFSKDEAKLSRKEDDAAKKPFCEVRGAELGLPTCAVRTKGEPICS